MGTQRRTGRTGRLQLPELTTVDVIIPALNEEASLPLVLADIPGSVRRVVVADNGSTDRTADVAREAGATVVHEPKRGYGHACLAGMAFLEADPPDIVVFLDGDYSDFPEELTR
jgi:glycosyltransferase involved in cell wall biosynthesis